MNDIVPIAQFLGQTFVSVENRNNNMLVFTTVAGKKYHMFHYQDCCESVTIDDICGDLNDLVGSPITMAEEATNCENPRSPDDANDSFTWTFYKLATVKGYVTIKWYGVSNGYYSESADIFENYQE